MHIRYDCINNTIRLRNMAHWTILFNPVDFNIIQFQYFSILYLLIYSNPVVFNSRHVFFIQSNEGRKGTTSNQLGSLNIKIADKINIIVYRIHISF